VSFEIVPQPEIDAARDAVQKIYGRVDAAFRQGGSDDAALRDATWRRYERQQPFAQWLAGSNFSGIQTSILSFRFAGAGARSLARAEVSRASEEGGVSGSQTYGDTWNSGPDGWTLKERVGLTGRYALPPTDAQTPRLVAADLKQLAAPLATAE